MRPAGVHAGRAAAPRSRLYQTSLSIEEGSAAVFSLHYESQASGGSEPAESSSKYRMLCRLRTEAGTGNLPWPSSTSVRFHGPSARRAIRAYGRERAHAGFERAPHAQSRFLPAATASGSSGGERRKASRFLSQVQQDGWARLGFNVGCNSNRALPMIIVFPPFAHSLWKGGCQSSWQEECSAVIASLVL